MENDTESYFFGAHFAALKSGEIELLGEGLTGEDLAAVPEHWLSYPAPPASAHTALALLYTFFTAAALLGNGLVIFIFSTHSTITRPLDGRLSRGKVLLMMAFVWIYATPWALLPLFKIWGRFVPEGYLTSCTFDYLTNTFDTKLFVACIFTCSYVFPMSMIIYFYSGIVKQVFAHEAALREQAKKMNVESLRANQSSGAESAEIRIAKAALTVCFLFVASWTPYGVMALIGAFGDQQLLTPGVTMIPAVACKAVACIDPWVYAISHPKYRQELQRRMPWLQIDEPDDSASTATTNTAPNAPA
uniref:Ultraviolet wavelength sensitive opsin isoform B n=1 Tax=Biston betularia TaxID=82595 RepID=A0A4Y5FMY4_BISBE|nr:ultraviolet wavelength sensitive opsin isoform B [Biston betularia]